MNDFVWFVVSFAFLGLLLLVFVFGLFLVIPAAIAAAILYGVYQHYNGPDAKARQAEAETQALYQLAMDATPLAYDDFINAIEAELNDERLIELARHLYDAEGFVTPDPPPPNASSIEAARYRDTLNKFIAASHKPDRAKRFLSTTLSILKPLDTKVQSGTFKASRSRTPQEIENLILPFYDDHDFYKTLRATLDRNFNEQKSVMPSDYKGTNCPWDYLKDTPLLDLEYIETAANWANPENHTLVLAGSGAGKTTLFKHLIAYLLQRDVCVMVMDSQSQLIEELAHLELSEGELTWITPDHPLALNPFQADAKELADEAFVNNAIGQLEFVIDKLLDAPFTPRQKTLFFHATNLVLSIPNGNINTFFEILNDPYQFAVHIDRLDETSRRFFYEELKSEGKKPSAYDSTKTELRYRLDAFLKNPTLRRIFNTTENTFNPFNEMRDRKLILIDTSHALLADESPTFGRLMIAQTLQACYRRVKEKATHRPVVFFVDEAHEYFDEKLEMMLLQARKANVGLVIATQDLSRASKAGIADTILGSTTTKIISRTVSGDARRIAPMMRTEPQFLMDLQDYVFAFSSGREPALTIKANAYALSNMRQRDDLRELRTQMTERYGPKPKSKPKPKPEPAKDHDVDVDAEQQDQPKYDQHHNRETGSDTHRNMDQDANTDDTRKPTHETGQNAKPETSDNSKKQPGPQLSDPMSRNDDQDIEPSDTL